MPDPQPFTLAARLRSFRFAFRGLRLMVLREHNAWLHAAATLMVLVAGLALRLSRPDWCWIVLAIVGVWTAEAMNTSLEFLCDVASPDFHPLVERAKDVAAGAVLLAALGAVAIGLLVFTPHVLAILHPPSP